MIYTFVFYGSLLITIISNLYFGIYKEMYSMMYSEAINGLCMTLLVLGMAYEGYQKNKNKNS